MGYFKNKMRKFINWAQSDDYAKEPYINGIASLQNSMRGLNFTVYSATGGKVVQIRTYNIATDQSRSTLYIVSDKEDLGQELGHIITVESLSR